MNDRCTCITKAMHKYQNKLIHIRVYTSLIVYQNSQGIVHLFTNHLVKLICVVFEKDGGIRFPPKENVLFHKLCTLSWEFLKYLARTCISVLHKFLLTRWYVWQTFFFQNFLLNPSLKIFLIRTCSLSLSLSLFLSLSLSLSLTCGAFHFSSGSGTV